MTEDGYTVIPIEDVTSDKSLNENKRNDTSTCVQKGLLIGFKLTSKTINLVDKDISELSCEDFRGLTNLEVIFL